MQIPLNSDAISKDSSGRYFLPFQNIEGLKFNLKKVHVGYRCRIGINILQSILKGYGHKVEVIQTRPAFGEFSVVEQKARKFWNWEATPEDQTCPAEQALYGGDE
ncbi:hypothetical protein [Tropicibacter sp. Alg240-R139]|uniref:hypothetical protein n=1 Tax=Tropicibacter sp. Alg240-R139 TaxID=2305991 RepID=UPI0013DED649|nr:hypothetical protein [Tropicibacter sp. Alg240-R139]